MREAYICAYVRTPIGRYGGSLSGIRADDLAAVPLNALRGASPEPRLRGRRRRDLRLRQPGGRGQPQRGPHGGAAGGPARLDPGNHHEPPLRLGHGCGHRGRPRHQGGRSGDHDRRRRRIHVARALRDAEGRRGLLAQCRDLRHHHRLALHQPADQEPIRRRFHAGDRRERGRRLQRLARGPGRLRPALAEEGRRGSGERAPRQGDRAGHDPEAEGRSGHRRQGRASPRRHDPGAAGEAPDAVPQGRHGDGRQCLRRQ